MNPTVAQERVSRGRGKAFSLIELLVVVTIIALLSGMLLPVLSKAREAGRRAACVNNQKQLSVGAQLYWDDNQNEAFKYRAGFTNGGDNYWFGWIGAGMEGERQFDPAQGPLFKYFGDHTLAICPSLQYGSSAFKLKATGAAYGYGYDIHLSTPVSQPSFKITRLRGPTQTALFADAAQINTFQAPASPENPLLEEFYYISRDEPTVHFRHFGKALVSFCDGHVSLGKIEPKSLDTRLPSEKVGSLPTTFFEIP